MKLDLVDVFGAEPLRGNPLAVVRGAEALSSAQMQAITCWLGFSETTFLLPPTDPAADYRVRIFYPAGELPFAGHPTLGTALAWMVAGGVAQRPGVIMQQCGVGLVEVRGGMADGAGRLAFRAPPLIRSGPLDDVARAEAIALAGVDAGDVVDGVWADNGPGWRLLRLVSAEAVLRARPQARAPVATDIGLVGPHAPGGEAAWEVRAFFTKPSGELVEDPVTGSLNAAVAQVLFGQGLAGREYVAAQGQKIGAEGRIFVTQDEGRDVWIGGDVVMISRGGTLSDRLS